MRRVLVGGLLVLVTCASVVLLAGGFLARGCVQERSRARLAEALDAEVAIDETRVSLTSGRVEHRGVSIRRDGVDIQIESIRASLPSMGRMIVSRRLRRVDIEGAVFEMSARGAVAIARRERKPLRMERLVMTGTTIAVAPTLLLPGLGRIELKIDLADSRDVELSNALSWITELDALVANAVLPAGAGAGVDYREGNLTLSGSWFGTDALTLPFEIPTSSDDVEVDQLVTLARALAKAIGKHVAKDKLIDAAKRLLE